MMDANTLSLRMLFNPVTASPPPRWIQRIVSSPTSRSTSLMFPGPRLFKSPNFTNLPSYIRASSFMRYHWCVCFLNQSPTAAQKSKEQTGIGSEDGGLPPEFYDEEWQARQREKTKEWHAYRKKEEEEESRKTSEYHEIGMRLKGYPEEEVCKARKLVSSFIRSAEEVEEKIEEAAEKGELSELVLMVIWNRLDLARRDDEKDVIRSLDLLYRRIETEILKRESTPAMRLLNDLLNLQDGFDDDEWLKKCRKCMIDTFPREDPFSMLVPAGFDIDNHQGPIKLPPEDDDVLLRVDFVRELDALLQEVREEQDNPHHPDGLDPESVAARLKQQEKQRTIHQVEALLDLAISLKW